MLREVCKRLKLLFSSAFAQSNPWFKSSVFPWDCLGSLHLNPTQHMLSHKTRWLNRKGAYSNIGKHSSISTNSMDAPHCLLNTQDFRLAPTMAIITTSFISLTEQLTPPPDKATKLGEIPSHSQFHYSALENNRQCQCSQMQLFHMSGFSPSTCLPDETMIPPSNPVKFTKHRSFPAELNEKKGRN